MTAKELIEKLNAIVAVHGDLPVKCAGSPVEEVKLNTPPVTKSFIELTAFAD